MQHGVDKCEFGHGRNDEAGGKVTGQRVLNEDTDRLDVCH